MWVQKKNLHTTGVGVSEAKFLKWKLACVARVKQERQGGRRGEGEKEQGVGEWRNACNKNPYGNHCRWRCTSHEFEKYLWKTVHLWEMESLRYYLLPIAPIYQSVICSCEFKILVFFQRLTVCSRSCFSIAWNYSCHTILQHFCIEL